MDMSKVILIGGAVMLLLHGISILMHMSSNTKIVAVGDALDKVRKDAAGVGVKEPVA